LMQDMFTQGRICPLKLGEIPLALSIVQIQKAMLKVHSPS
jgi:hypothetical protein